jgi:chemotaxis protein CheZ
MTREGLPAASPAPQAATDAGEARNRLDYVVRKSGEAVDRVLNSVDQAREEQEQICAAVRELRSATAGHPLAPVVERLAASIEASSGRTRERLTDILLAQSFHDLIGQVATKVGQLVSRMEDNLGGAPAGATGENRTDVSTRPPSELAGPVIDATGRDDVLTDQDEVDALLAKTGF